MKRQDGRGSWMASGRERNVAIGVAIAATLVVTVLILMPREPNPEHPPTFSLPEKPKAAARPQTSVARKTRAAEKTIQSVARSAQPTKKAAAKSGHAHQSASGHRPTAHRGARQRPVQTHPAAQSPGHHVPHGYYVQAGAFRDAKRATHLARRLAKSGWPTHIKDKKEGLRAVLVGPWRSRAKAMNVKKTLSSKRIKGFIAHY